MMPNINEAFPSRFLKAADLRGREPVVTIARVAFEPMGHTREVKAVVYFVGKAKGLKLNKTMATAISAIAGSPLTEAWIGVALCLYATSAAFGRDTFPVVRVKAPAKGQA
jgi:uncharacterized membrane protein